MVKAGMTNLQGGSWLRMCCPKGEESMSSGLRIKAANGM